VFLQVVNDAYAEQADLTAQGLELTTVGVQPGTQADRIGVAVLARPLNGKRIPKDRIHMLQEAFGQSIWRVRRHTFELSSNQDLFAERPELCDEAPWMEADEVLGPATAALVRASRRREQIYHVMPRGKEQLIDVTDVKDSPPSLTGTIVIEGLVDGHTWSRAKLRILGTAVESSLKHTLDGVQRTYETQVPSDADMHAALKLSIDRKSARWCLQQLEILVAGGEKKIEYRLSGPGMPT
jgi:hypothetical protein